MKPIVILGRARPDGKTRKAVDLAFPPGSAELVVLPNFTIGGYMAMRMTASRPSRRRWRRPMHRVRHYWYAMSAPMKIFFDRITDMTQNLKPLGKTLAGKPVWVIATGEEDVLPDGFEVPFDRTATYLGMAYQGAAYLCSAVKAKNRHAEETALSHFGQKILSR